MKRFEPNLLLAISTAFALALLLMTASLLGVPGTALRNILLGVICAGGFVLLNAGAALYATTRPGPCASAPACNLGEGVRL